MPEIMKDKSICGIPPISRFDLCEKCRMPISSERLPNFERNSHNAADVDQFELLLVNISFHISFSIVFFVCEAENGRNLNV